MVKTASTGGAFKRKRAAIVRLKKAGQGVAAYPGAGQPGMSALATRMMQKEMDKLDIPPVPEFVEMVHDAGARLYACKATVDLFHLTPHDFVPQVEKVLTVGEFYALSAGAQIIY